MTTSFHITRLTIHGTASNKSRRLLVLVPTSPPPPPRMWSPPHINPECCLSWCPPIPPPFPHPRCLKEACFGAHLFSPPPPTMCGTASNESRSLLPWSYQGHINEQLMYRLIYTRNGAELFIDSLGSTCSTNWVHYCQSAELIVQVTSSADISVHLLLLAWEELIAISDYVIVQKPILYTILYSVSLLI